MDVALQLKLCVPGKLSVDLTGPMSVGELIRKAELLAGAPGLLYNCDPAQYGPRLPYAPTSLEKLEGGIFYFASESLS